MFARALALDQLWNVSRTDASNGFANVSSAQNGTLMVTSETKFIMVTDSGTADLKVDTYTGLEELLNGQYDQYVLYNNGICWANAISSNWTVTDVAIVNNGINVSTIYVLAVTSPA